MGFAIYFGAMAPTLAEQLADYEYDKDEMKHLQFDADAVSRLAVRGVLTEGAASKARQRLVNRIAKSVRRRVPAGVER
jgi:hypothetical protein